MNDAQGSRIDTRREDIGARLIAATERLLTDGLTYPDITVNRLVKEAGISRSRFYVHFKDKSDLLGLWFAKIRRTLLDVDDAWWDIREDATQADLRDALHRISLAYHPHNLMMAAMYDQAAFDSTTRHEIEEIERHRITRLEQHIKEGQAGGWIAPELLPAETAAWLTHTGARGYQRMAEGSPGLTIGEFVDRYAQYVWLVLYEPTRR